MLDIYELLALMACVFILGMHVGHYLTVWVMSKEFARQQLNRRMHEVTK